MADTVVNCEQCVVKSLYPEYPWWRRQIALSIIIVHCIFLTLISLLWIIHHNDRYLQGRDRHLLLLVGIGTAVSVHTAVREWVGEANYPCAAHYSFTNLTAMLIVGTTIVRSLRVAAKYMLQRRVDDIMEQRHRRGSFGAAVVTPEATADWDSRSPDSNNNMVDSNNTQDVTADGKPSLQYNSAPGHDWSYNRLAPLPIGVGTPVVTPTITTSTVITTAPLSSTTATAITVRSGNSGSDAVKVRVKAGELTRSDHSFIRLATDPLAHKSSTIAHKIVLDILHLHTATGQLVVWLAFALCSVVATISKIASEPQIFLHGYGCYYDAADLESLAAVTALTIALQGSIFWCLRNSTDVFGLKNEVGALVVLSVVGGFAVCIMRAVPEVVEYTAPNYCLILAGWSCLMVAFLAPTLKARADRRRAEVRVVPAATAATAYAFDTVPTEDAAQPAIALHRMPSEDLQRRFAPLMSQASDSTLHGAPGSSPLHYQHVARTKALLDTMWSDDDRLICTHLMQLLTPSASVLDVEEAFLSALRKNAISFTREDYDVLAIFLCGTALGRKYFRSYLSKEWCSEMLLFLIDAASYASVAAVLQRRALRISHLEVNFVSATQLSKLLESTRSAAGRTNAVATEILQLYLVSGAMLPINVSSSVQKEAWHRLHHLREGIAKFEISASANGIDTSGFDITAIVTLFRSAELELLSMISFGPVLRFVSHPEFASFREEMRALLDDSRSSCVIPQPPLS